VDLQSTSIELFGKPYRVFGYPDEGWYNILVNSKGVYSEFNVENLRPFISRDSVCLDIGANIGVLSLAMATLAPQGAVYAFEGSPPTYLALVETVKHSGFANIETHPWIVGNGKDSGEWVEDKQWQSSSHYVPCNTHQESRRISHAIDEFKFPRVDLIKIDVEGGELDVLDGMMETLHRCHPIVVMEFNSFAMIHYREIIPRKALDRIFQIFTDEVGYFQGRTGGIAMITDREAFLRNNMFGGFVDDLVCSVL
jgi:FkbM family methyltransferase